MTHAQPISLTHGVTADSNAKAPSVSDSEVKSGKAFTTNDGDKCREVFVIGVRQWICLSQQDVGHLDPPKPVYTYPRSGWAR